MTDPDLNAESARELLRRAARRLRETSGDASPSAALAFALAGAQTIKHAAENPIPRSRQLAAIDHYAVWTLRAALAVADWLEAEAELHGTGTPAGPETHGERVALAILREEET